MLITICGKQYTSYSFILIKLPVRKLLMKTLLKRLRELELTKKDELTGVYTKREGRRILEHRLEKKQPACYGCMFMDLDDFKLVNDGLGHEEGDKLLKTVGRLIDVSLREQDIAYRFGGDEFCVWLFGKGGRAEIEMIANRIMSKAAKEKQKYSLV